MSTLDVARAELALAVLYLNKAEARDKICRDIQYGSKLVSNSEPGAAQNVDKSTNLARKVFRLFKFINDLHGLISPPVKGTPLPLILLGKTKLFGWVGVSFTRTQSVHNSLPRFHVILFNGIPWSTFEPQLRSKGKVIDITPGPAIMWRILSGNISFSKKQIVPLLLIPKGKNLAYLVKLVKEGKLMTVVDSKHPLNKTEDACLHKIRLRMLGLH